MSWHPQKSDKLLQYFIRFLIRITIKKMKENKKQKDDNITKIITAIDFIFARLKQSFQNGTCYHMEVLVLSVSELKFNDINENIL